MAAAKQDVSPLMLELSTYLAGAMKKKLPAEVAERARIHLLDVLSAMISGSTLLPGRRAIEYAQLRGGPREALVVGSRTLTSIYNATLANGMLGHADETDDTHPPSLTHPGTSVVPSALALAERDGIDGRTFLRAVVLGYDLCSRVLLALRPMPFLRSGHHAGAFGQVFGAAAAAGGLLRFDARRMRYLLSYTAQQAAGLSTMFRDPEHIEKSFAMGGMPAARGLESALMVDAGFTGVEDVFSGQWNFFSTLGQDPDPGELVRGLGTHYEIMRAGIKRWAVGGPIQGPLWVLYDLMREHGFRAQDVESLVARMPDTELAIVDNRDNAEISVQHLLAVMLVDGIVTFRSSHDDRRMRDPKIRAARAKVTAVGDPALVDKLRRWRCVMDVRLKDGRTLHGETMAAKGSFENPIDRTDETEKCMDLLAPVIGKARATKLVAAVWDIEKIADLKELRPLLRA
jgi:2-methylcitrate dehydratase PrpD